jgi:hypothetical protein
VSAEPDTAAGSAAWLGMRPGTCRVLAGRLLSTADTAAALSRAETPRPPVADHPGTPADCGSGHRPPPRTLPGVRGASGTATTWRCRPDGWMVAAARCPVGYRPGRCKRPRSTAASATTAGIRTAAVHPGPCRRLRVSAATGTGCQPGGDWRVPPPPPRSGELTVQPVAKLAAHVGHRRPLQGQGLLGGQPAQPQPAQVAALPAGHHRTGGRMGVDPDLGPGVGRPGAQLHGEVGEEHQLAGIRSGWPVSSSYSAVPSGCGTPGCSSAAGATTSTPAASAPSAGSRGRPR